MSSYAKTAYVKVRKPNESIDSYVNVTTNSSDASTPIGTQAQTEDGSTKTVIANIGSQTGATSLSNFTGTIGYTGNTGNSSEAHLHFGMSDSSGNSLDPFYYVLFPGVCYLNSSV